MKLPVKKGRVIDYVEIEELEDEELEDEELEDEELEDEELEDEYDEEDILSYLFPNANSDDDLEYELECYWRD